MELRTQRFYEPLKNSLDKSLVRPHNIYTDPLSLTKSRIDSPHYSLSPQQADFIKRTTYVPVDKTLIPTNHIQKVRGKKFRTIDYQVKRGHPIPQQIFKSSYNRSPTKQQIVYELANAQSNIRSFTSQYRTGSPIIRYQQPLKYTNRSISQRRLIGLSKVPVYYKRLPYRDLESIKDRENMRMTSEYFPIHKKAKNNYKYNLFSLLDESVNSKCSSFGRNQIIAKKLGEKAWN